LELMLTTLQKRFELEGVSKGGKYTSVAALLNSYKSGQSPQKQSNCLMIAANAGSIGNVKVLLDFGADSFNNGKETFHDESFVSAAKYAFEANFYELAYLLDPEETLVKLRENFRDKCEANFHIKYLNSTFPALGSCLCVLIRRCYFLYRGVLSSA